MPLHPELLKLLVCPQCKGELHLTGHQDGLVCDACKLIYEIRDDIPVMLVEEARPLTP